MIHVATIGGKVGNYKAVKTKAKKNKVEIEDGKSFKRAGKGVPQSKKLKVKAHTRVRYESANNDIAKVTAKGVIKAEAKGTTYVYAYSQDGKYTRIKVTIK